MLLFTVSPVHRCLEALGLRCKRTPHPISFKVSWILVLDQPNGLFNRKAAASHLRSTFGPTRCMGPRRRVAHLAKLRVTHKAWERNCLENGPQSHLNDKERG